MSGAAVEHLGEGLLAFAVGLPAFAAVALLTRALYVRGHALAGGAALAAGWTISAVGPLVTIGPGSTPQEVLVGLGTWWSGGMVVAALVQWYLVVRAWGGHALRPAVPAVVASVLGVGVVALLSWGLRGTVPVGGSVAATLGLGVLAGAAGAVAQLALVLVGHRRGLAELVPRGRRVGGE